MNAPASPLPFPSRLGLGTWMMGESRATRARERAALTHALQLGYRLFDTAELYGDGGAERLLGLALRDFGSVPRAELCVVSKVKPVNASRAGTIAACEASLERLGCHYLDVYLLHWPGPHGFGETLTAFAELQQRGLIRHFGVSNFDLPELIRWRAAEHSLGLGAGAVCNQLYYCLQARGIEFELLGWQRAHGLMTMAYSPLGRGRLAHDARLRQLARQRGASAAQLALAWSIREPDVVAIPKSSDPQRIEENWRSRELRLDAHELAQLDQLFAPPRSREPLEMV
jgi:diketogulonate reductase-like aldo/keto reductase